MACCFVLGTVSDSAKINYLNDIEETNIIRDLSEI
jgi:hypothetical protein